MTLREVLTTCRTAGIVLVPSGTALEVDAPSDALTPELCAELRAHKPTLLEVLWRVDAMRRLAVQAPRPLVYARAEAQGGPGFCFSCGARLEPPEAYGRCTPCDVAADVYYATTKPEK